MAGVGFLPLFGGPGYEQSLASGLVAPAASAIVAALELSALPEVSPLGALARGLRTGAVLAGIALLTGLLHGLRVGICDLWGGLLFFLLTAGVGALVGGVWGALVAEVARARKRRRLAAVLLALAGPLGGIVVSLLRFYGSPMVFAFDPFFGFFSGTLYDTEVEARPELWTYRAGSAATIAGLLLVAAALQRGAEGRLSLRPLRGHPAQLACLLLGAASLATSVAIIVEGPALGHWHTADTIARALGGRASGPRCDVIHPDSLLAEQAALLVRDCEEELAADEQRMGTKLDGRLTAYFFRDADEKRRLMGAAQTSIAKPWRREVYVQMSGFPHPVLGHEIAHVVSGSFGRGPFRIAGGVGGLLPNPGLIEGIAVATAPDDDELTDAQWARAMMDLGTLPPPSRLFSLGFLGENASKSYTAAGAFVAWALDTYGAATVRAWYGGGSLDDLVHATWGEIDDRFRAWLRTLPMPPEASAYAKAKFERPSVWARRCPHVVDALDHAADKCRDDHRYTRALSLYEDALARDPHDWHARYDRAKVELWFFDEARGREELARLADDEQTPRTWRDRAREALADHDLARGRDGHAAEVYRAIAAASLDEDAARTLEVKALAVSNPPARRAILDLLVGEPGRPVDSWLGALSLGSWAAETHEPLATYLVGKNLGNHEQYVRAAAWLDRAIDAGVPTAHIGREVLRERAVVACALADAASLDRVRELVEADDSPFAGSSGGRREWILRLVARCGG